VSLASTPAGALNVKVFGHQWWWDYQYEDSGVRTANELHIPTDRTVVLKMTSVDVIHSFWVPKLAGKQDVVPGRVNQLMIRADKPGNYYGQCAEFCALSHANMRLRVIAQTPAAYENWVASQQKAATAPSSAAASAGPRAFLTGKCVNCHAVEGTDARRVDPEHAQAPDLTHFASRGTFGSATFVRNDENLRRWLRDPPAMKPGSRMPNYVARHELNVDDIDALVAYMQSLQ
jgi:cytochrome c oxidase subunit 2